MNANRGYGEVEVTESWTELGGLFERFVIGAALAVAAAMVGNRIVGFMAPLRLTPSCLGRTYLSNLPLFAVAFSLPATASPSAVNERRSGLPRREALASPPPWSGPGGNSSSLPVRAEELPSEVLPSRPGRPGRIPSDGPSDHPAVHGGRSATIVRLFPREERREGAAEERSRGRAEAMRRHPAGKGRAQVHEDTVAVEAAPNEKRHLVQPGDTLWAIAQAHLQTDDLQRIARYWPLVHRANRALIGPDPNLIQPGWTLVLPPEGDR